MMRHGDRCPRLGSVLAGLLLWMVTASGAQAQHSGSGHEEGGESEAGEGRFTAALFLGATREHGSNEPTWGLEAGMNLSETWSIGGVVERADRERDSTLVLLGVGWHPFGPGWRFQLGLGRKDPEGEQESVMRTGLAYEKTLRHGWLVKPYIAVDFIENADNETVFGAYFGRTF